MLFVKCSESLKTEQKKAISLELEQTNSKNQIKSLEGNLKVAEEKHSLVLKERNLVFIELSEQIFSLQKKLQRECNIRNHITANISPALFETRGASRSKRRVSVNDTLYLMRRVLLFCSNGVVVFVF